MRDRFYPLLFCSLLVYWPSSTFSADYPALYDVPIRSAVDKWWPDLPEWKLWKSQLYAESRLDPNAVSPVGAEGIAQIMPATWTQVIRALEFPRDVSARDAGYAIEGGAYYESQLRKQWRTGRPQIERHWLSVASYNRGTGNIIRDQRECNDALLWDNIAPCTARHTVETVNYVRRIRQYWKQLQ